MLKSKNSWQKFVLQNFSALRKEELPQSLIQWPRILLQAIPPRLVTQVLSFEQIRSSKRKKYCVQGCEHCVCSHSRVQLFVTPWTVAWQAPLSMRFFKQEYWNGLPFPPLWDTPNPGIKRTYLVTLALPLDFFFFLVNFVIHWNETAMGLPVFPIPIPPPSSLSTRSL